MSVATMIPHRTNRIGNRTNAGLARELRELARFDAESAAADRAVDAGRASVRPSTDWEGLTEMERVAVSKATRAAVKAAMASAGGRLSRARLAEMLMPAMHAALAAVLALRAITYEARLEGGSWVVRRDGKAVYRTRSMATAFVEMRRLAKAEAEQDRVNVRTLAGPVGDDVEVVFTPTPAA